MLSYVSIKDGVVDKIQPLADDLGVKITANEIRSGFKKPAFFIRLIPVSIGVDPNSMDNSVMINIEYFPANKTELELLEMIDSLNYVFCDGILQLENEVITIDEINPEITENILQYKIIARPAEIIKPDESEFELMKDLIVNFEK